MPEYQFAFTEDPPTRYGQTLEDYREVEAWSDIAFEYRRGTVVPRVGLPVHHTLAVTDVIGNFDKALDDTGFTLAIPKLRVMIAEDYFLYPDFSIFRSDLKVRRDLPGETMLDPLVIIELLSEETVAADYDEKARAYRACASIAEYILIDTREPHAERWCRSGEQQWTFTEHTGPDALVPIETCGVVFPLSCIHYDRNLRHAAR